MIRAWCPLPPLIDFHRTLPLIQIQRQTHLSPALDQDVQSSWRFSRVAMMPMKYVGFSVSSLPEQWVKNLYP